MKDDFNLTAILERVANGKIPVSKAKNMIEKHFSGEDSFEGGKDKLRNAFDKLKKSVNLEEFFKISSQFVQQISENVPQKIHENFSPIGFSSKIEGVDSRLSVFRAMEVSSDNVIEDNQVIGCQWFGVNFSGKCSVKHNKFTAMQLTELTVQGSDLCESQFSLSRMSHVTLQESCFMKNKFSLSTWSDASVTESDFTENTLNRSDFSGAVINSSRLSALSFLNVNFKDCEFDSCDIQGIEFDNCEFKDCNFHQIQAVATAPIKVSGCRLVGKQISQCNSIEEFVELLKGN